MIAASAISAGGNIVDNLFGFAMQGRNDRRQIRQQKKLMALQIKGQKEMGLFNQGLAMDMWNKTNYEAQRRHIENAGLNAGLMYGGAGAGATTQTPTGNVSGGDAPMGGGEVKGLGMTLQSVAQLALLKAQKENIEADTKQKEVNTAKTAGVDTEAVKASIKLVEEKTKGTQLENEGQVFTNKLLEVQKNVGEATEETQVNTLKQNYEKLVEETGIAKTQNKVDNATADEVIKQAKAQTLQIGLQNALIKSQTLTQDQLTQEAQSRMFKIAEEIVNMQQLRELKGRELENEIVRTTLDKIRTEFGTGTTAEMIRQVQTLTPLIQALSGAQRTY